MTPAAILALLKERLRVAIDSHKAEMKRCTDTGTMWRLSAYEEVLKFIETKESET